MMILLALAFVLATPPPTSDVTVREERGVYSVSARFVVPQSPGVVFAVLTDYERIPRFSPGVKTSTVLERGVGSAVVEQEATSRLMMFSKTVHLVLEISEGTNTLRFRDRSGRSFTRYEGVWRLSGAGGGTSIVYELTAQPSFDVPEFVLKRLLKRDSAQMIQGLRREMSARGQSKEVVMSSRVKSLWQWVSRHGASTSEPSVRPLRVLIVDDEEGVRAFVSRVVSTAGFEVAIASDAAEALAIASTKSFDLLLTDLMMPRMYGDELARRLRLQSPGLRVLYLTGNSDLLFAKQMILLDGEAFLDKPCTKAALLEAVSLAATDRIAGGSRSSSGGTSS